MHWPAGRLLPLGFLAAAIGFTLGAQGKLVQVSQSELEVWVKPLQDGSRAVLLFNRASVPTTITAHGETVGLGTRRARTAW